MSAKKRLTRAERKQIEAAIARANRTDKTEKSAQDSIPYKRMMPDGICVVTDTYFTKTIQFQDINYQLSQNEDKTAIFEAWCDFLNFFDASVKFQLTFANLSVSKEVFTQSISIPPKGDEFDSIREEYAQMLQRQLERGNNGLVKTKYLTFGIEAQTYRMAKMRLERLEIDILNNFKRLGVKAAVLNGKERLQVLHDILRMDEQEPFLFNWDWLAPSGLSTKDFIAPSSFEYKNGKGFRMGKLSGAVSFLQILAPELNDRILAEFLNLESSVIVNLHVQSVDQVNAIKTIKRKITDLDRAKIEEQKKAVRSGYDMDIIPSDLATYGAEAKKLLQDLQSRNERMFLLTFLVLNTSENPRQLNNNIFQIKSIAQKHNCSLVRLDYQQEEGVMSSLPLGMNYIDIQRGLTSSCVAIFIPFTTQELFQTGKEALYYGINALSNNLTYPRTDSRYLTNDMESAVPDYAAAAAAILSCELPKKILPKQVCNSKKVSDHHAVIPSLSAKNVDASTLPAGEQTILMLVAQGFLRGICPEYRIAETVVTAECAGHTFRARGKEILKRGWTVFSFRESQANVLPAVTEGQIIPVNRVSLKGGKTTPPKYYTEDTLLAAMENAGIQDMPEDAERKGIGTPATRSGILEKLISDNFVIRTKSKKVSYLRPTELGIALITVLPEQLQSPLLTAEWEHRLKLVENGTLSDSDFMQGISEMLTEMVEEYKPYPGSEVLFPEKEDVVGKCPRCGTNVEERKRGFFCQNPNCRFVLWKNSRFFEVKKKKLDRATAAALLKFGQVPMKGCYSEKTGKTYDATAILVDKGDKVDFKLEFDNG